MLWTYHIQEVIHKASKTLNFLKQTLYQCESTVKASAYLTLVRPILEYAKVVTILKWCNGMQPDGSNKK